jgi:hypothetical protein
MQKFTLSHSPKKIGIVYTTAQRWIISSCKTTTEKIMNCVREREREKKRDRKREREKKRDRKRERER